MRIRKLDLNLIQQLHAKEVIARRRVLSHVLEGSWAALLKGRGMEFAGFRQYTYGDDASRIDWGASLKSKETLIREFEEYKSVNVLFLIDVGDTMCVTSTRKLKCEHAAELVFLLAAAILDNGDGVGYAMFTDRIVSRANPLLDREILTKMAAGLSDPRNYGGRKDLAGVTGLVDATLKSRALIILVSDYLSLGEGWERGVRALAQRHDLIGIRILDPRDQDLPTVGSQFLLEDPATGETLLIDVPRVRVAYAAETKREEGYLKGVFHASKAGLVTVRTDGDMVQPILAYFRRRTAIIR